MNPHSKRHHQVQNLICLFESGLVCPRRFLAVKGGAPRWKSKPNIVTIAQVRGLKCKRTACSPSSAPTVTPHPPPSMRHRDIAHNPPPPPLGAGKSTTINMLTGVIPAHEGDAIVLGRSIRSSSGMNYIR